MANRPHVRAGFEIDVFQAHRMLAWHDEKVTRCDGIQIHEHDNSLVFMNITGFHFVRSDRAEDALIVCLRPVRHAVMVSGGRAVLREGGQLRAGGDVRREAQPHPCLGRGPVSLVVVAGSAGGDAVQP